jgi:glycosyltransferase involved in cell wall biosynthesis
MIDCLIPCFNEEASLPTLLTALDHTISLLSEQTPVPLSLGIILVNDGSRDNTAAVAGELLSKKDCFARKCIVSLSRNFGKEAALLAGLRNCDSDACIIMDADLQDPPTLMITLIEQWLQGYKVVNAVRRDLSDDSPMKRITARVFYWLFGRFSHLSIQFDSSDFRLLDRAGMDAILACSERVRFSKAFFAWVGFDQANVYFKRPKRLHGQSKWGNWRLWNYALDGIFSFSTSPLRIWSYIGAAVTAISFLLGLIAVVRTIFYGIDVPGYASLFTAVTFLGGAATDRYRHPGRIHWPHLH